MDPFALSEKEYLAVEIEPKLADFLDDKPNSQFIIYSVMHGEFVWIDLSALRFRRARSFYEKAFSWRSDSGSDGYFNFFLGEEPVAGFFDMPPFFRKIKMPSFWMSYIETSDLDLTVPNAESAGGKIELTTENALGKIALIRDPAGAGFTAYEGTAMKSRQCDQEPGKWIRSELFVNALGDVDEFYRKLFEWSFVPDNEKPGRFAINSAEGETISYLQEATSEERDGKVYWVPFFGVEEINATEKQMKKLGGRCYTEYSVLSDRPNAVVYDSQGSFFFVEEIRK